MYPIRTRKACQSVRQTRDLSSHWARLRPSPQRGLHLWAWFDRYTSVNEPLGAVKKRLNVCANNSAAVVLFCREVCAFKVTLPAACLDGTHWTRGTRLRAFLRKGLNPAGCSTALTAGNTIITGCPHFVCRWKLEHAYQAVDCMEKDVPNRRPAARLGRKTLIHTALDRPETVCFLRRL